MSTQRGFGLMEKERLREIASAGGKAAHAQNVAHEFTPEEARAAGRLGGAKVSRDREHMARIGRIGGRARSEKKIREKRGG
jgi:general stress protein YciG